jgi:hypothetical protein
MASIIRVNPENVEAVAPNCQQHGHIHTITKVTSKVKHCEAKNSDKPP